ncbi:mitotic-spindle organizing protein 1B isoform X2 [Eucalyptus grandis]|nr:mitotic-spindle organizing protein 1B isoform X2 [Eucalyptus grandis]
MDQEAARTARESLDLAFHMSNILDTGLDRHTLSVLIALCDLGVNPEALAAVVRELHREPSAAAVPMPGPYEVRRPSLGPIPRAGSGTRS